MGVLPKEKSPLQNWSCNIKRTDTANKQGYRKSVWGDKEILGATLPYMVIEKDEDDDEDIEI